MAKSVEVTKSNGGIHIRLNRPEKRNAFDQEMIASLTTALREIPQDDDIRYVLMSGNGQSFCAGADLDWMTGSIKYSYSENLADSRKLYDMFDAIDQCSIPVIGRVHGHVYAGGVGLVAVCDVVAAEASAVFAFSEVKLGIVPAVISGFARKKLSRTKAFELMMTGRRFSAKEALDAQLINFVGTGEDADKFVKETIAHFMSAGPEAVKEIRRLLRFMDTHSAAEVKEETIRAIAEVRVSVEGQAGLKSFVDKKNPPWIKS
jgi:methylglutaconyl-CoA hydratase